MNLELSKTVFCVSIFILCLSFFHCASLRRAWHHLLYVLGKHLLTWPRSKLTFIADSYSAPGSSGIFVQRCLLACSAPACSVHKTSNLDAGLCICSCWTSWGSYQPSFPVCSILALLHLQTSVKYTWQRKRFDGVKLQDKMSWMCLLPLHQEFYANDKILLCD